MDQVVETTGWAVQPPWDGLGMDLPAGMTVDEMLVKAGLNWEVEKRPSYYQTREGFKPVPDQYHLVRKTDEAVLTSVGRSYVPVQNREALTFFMEFVQAGDMRMEVAGSFSNGRRVWALASLRDGFTLPGGDEVRGYLLFTNPHMAGYSLLTQFTPIRVDCANILTYAEQTKSGGTSAYRHPHFTRFDPKRAKEVLGLARFQLHELEEASRLLASRSFNDITVRQYFAEVFEPNKVRAAAEDDQLWSRLLDLPRVRDAVRLLDDQPGATRKAASGTWWGAYNVVTYMANHVLGRNADTRMSSALYGEYRGFSLRALSKALDYAKQA